MFDAVQLGDQLSLDHGWLFHTGDDPGWAAPDLNDSAWTPVDLEKPLATYGVPPSTRFGWLRLRIHLAPQAVPPVVGIYRSFGRYQVFANGYLLGSMGDMNRHDLEDSAFIAQFPVPARAMISEPNRQDLVLALRLSLQDVTYGSDPPQAPFRRGEVLLGTARSLTQDNLARTLVEVAPIGLNIVPSLLIGLVALVLFLSMRSHREYLLLALFCLSDSGASLRDLLSWLMPFDVMQSALGSVTQLAVSLSLLGFFQLLLPTRRPRLFAVLALLAAGAAFGGSLWSTGLISFSVTNALLTLDTVFHVMLTVVLLREYGRGAAPLRSDLTLLLPGYILLVVSEVNYSLGYLFLILEERGFRIAALLPERMLRLSAGPFRFQYSNLGSLAFEFSILVFLVARTVRIARERNRAAAEIEAAQTVQQLLLARSAPQLPAFRSRLCTVPQAR